MSEPPNRFDNSAAIDRLNKFWIDGCFFHAEPDEQRQPYTIVIPPPNVTGALHLGHALNNTLQDIQIRMKRMQGFNALWMPGTDHAGIATQAVVERRLKEEENKTRHDLGREKLVERIWAWKDQYEKRILGQLQQMGCSCDWRRTRFTLDPICARAVRHTFFDLFRKEYIFRGKRLVNWDTHLRTAVSDDEVEQKPVKGYFWHFDYPIIDPRPGEPTHVTIATTRPETMLGDTAVAVHPNPSAAFDKVAANLRQKLAKGPAKEKAETEAALEALERRREEMSAPLEQLAAMAQAGRQLMLPLVDREIPLVADVWAKPEMGSGCVKITPAHDPNDYMVGQRGNLPMVNILNADGTLNEDAGTYAGMTIKQARKKVVADMDELGLLRQIEDKEIELPHSDRSKTPIEPFLADQWFVKMDVLAQSAIDAVEDGRVEIIPHRYARGYIDWLAEKRDWPVSRQLWWGHRIPVWSKVCASEADLGRALDELKDDPHVASGAAAQQVEITNERDSARLPGSKVELPHAYIHVCIQEEDEAVEAHFAALGFEQVDDVLDTWFSSALWPHSTLGWPTRSADLSHFYPTTTLITSRDILTLWVARMVLMGLNNMGDIPFSKVFIHPKILDGDGETMSKSKGNGIDPIDVINKFGADALRFSMAHLTTETQDVRLPVFLECPSCEERIKQTKDNRTKARLKCPQCQTEFRTQWAESAEDLALPRGPVTSERFEQARNFCNKLWNASRFALMRMDDYEPGAIDVETLDVEDRWLLSRLTTVTHEVTEAFEAFRYSEAVRKLYEFAWEDFCSFYIEMAKDRLQRDDAKATAQRVLAHSLDCLLRLLHPVIPFITEEVWQLLNEAAPHRGLDPSPAAPSVMTADWPQVNASHQDAEMESRFATFQQVLGKVREIRSSQNIAPKEQVTFRLRCDNDTVDLLQPMAGYFQTMANASLEACGPEATPPEMNATVTLPGIEVYLDLEKFIDVEAEIARVEKELANVDKQRQAKTGKLSNANFVDRAPADIVQRERDSLAELEERAKSLAASLERLRGTGG